MDLNNKSRGFTLIEVVLVLAIGGLIFLLAFLAFRQVSTNRRDTQRRSDVRRMLAEAQNFAGDNTNQFPCTDTNSWACYYNNTSTSASWTNFQTNYLSNKFKDPSSSTSYTYLAWNGSINLNLSNFFRTALVLRPGNVVYALRATCVSGDLTTVNTNAISQFGFWIVNERGRGTCVDNST